MADKFYVVFLFEPSGKTSEEFEQMAANGALLGCLFLTDKQWDDLQDHDAGRKILGKDWGRRFRLDIGTSVSSLTYGIATLRKSINE